MSLKGGTAWDPAEKVFPKPIITTWAVLAGFSFHLSLIANPWFHSGATRYYDILYRLVSRSGFYLLNLRSTGLMISDLLITPFYWAIQRASESC